VRDICSSWGLLGCGTV